MSKIVSLATAVTVAVGLSFVVSSVPDARAVPVEPVITQPAPPELFTVDPDDYFDSAWWDPQFTPQNPLNAEAELEAVFGLDLEYVSISGSCAQAAVTCTESGGDKSGSINLGDLTASVFGVHIGGEYFAFVYDYAISIFSISGLSNGVSNIHAFTTETDVIPLPAGLLLFLTGLAGVGVLGRYKAKRQAPASV